MQNGNIAVHVCCKSVIRWQLVFCVWKTLKNTRYDALTTAWSSSVACISACRRTKFPWKRRQRTFSKAGNRSCLITPAIKLQMCTNTVRHKLYCTVRSDWKICFGFNWNLCYQWDEMYLRCRAPEVLQLLSLRLVMCDETVIDSESSERGSEQVSSDSAWYTSNDKANVMIRLCTEKVLLSKNQGFKIHLVWFKIKWIWGIKTIF